MTPNRRDNGTAHTVSSRPDEVRRQANLIKDVNDALSMAARLEQRVTDIKAGLLAVKSLLGRNGVA